MRAVDDVPFGPTTCTEAKRRCGIPSTVMSLFMRSSPNRMPNSSRSSRYASASRRVIRGVIFLLVGAARRERGRDRGAGGGRLLAAEGQQDPQPDPEEQQDA